MISSIKIICLFPVPSWITLLWMFATPDLSPKLPTPDSECCEPQGRFSLQFLLSRTFICWKDTPLEMHAQGMPSPQRLPLSFRVTPHSNSCLPLGRHGFIVVVPCSFLWSGHRKLYSASGRLWFLTGWTGSHSALGVCLNTQQMLLLPVIVY